MAVTDDIAERVASILFETLLRSANYATETLPNAVSALGSGGSKAFHGVSSLATEMVKHLDTKRFLTQEGEVNYAELNQAANRLKTKAHTIRIGDTDRRDFEAMLLGEGVLYSKIDMKDDDCTMFMYLDKDKEKVELITQALQAREGKVTELSPSLFVQSLQPEKTMTMDGLDDVELELFRHYAKQTNVLFTTVPRGNNKHMVIYPKDDVNNALNARQAMLHVGWALTGVDGAKIREQIQHRLRGRSAINISAEEGLRELYVVSRLRPGNFVRITSEDYRVYKANKQVATTSRSAPNFSSRCLTACLDGLDQPVVMTADEFDQMTPEKLERCRTLEIFPREFDDMVELNIQRGLASLMAQKMALDDEGNADWGITDPSVSYSEFASYEFIMDDEEREGRELQFEHFKKAMFYAKDNFSIEEVNRDGKNLDYIIANAEAKKRSILGEEFQPGKEHAGQSAGHEQKASQEQDFEVL